MTESEALAMPGELYRHYKGGIYRVIARGARHSETQETGTVYEHLWPHEPGIWFRPDTPAGFFDALPDGRPRFERITH
jgi:hypothetical protein